jgi:hypothetical protein
MEYKYYHYSEKDFVLDREKDYTQNRNAKDFYGNGKPYGFWVSVASPNDWEHFFTSENFMPEHYALKKEVLIDPKNIKFISSEKSFLAFEEKYGFTTPFGSRQIDWFKVAKHYKGIIIPKMLWIDGFPSWYSFWDCTSGCIWDLSAIIELR